MAPRSAREAAPPARVAIVTGAGSGIGAATARRLASDGWRVVIAGRRPDPLRAIADATGALAVPCDVSVPADVDALVERTLAEHGRLDGLVLNAGVALAGSVAELSIEDWNATIATNLTGPFLLAKAALPELLRRRGAIVGVGSIAAVGSGPSLAAYGPSKAGLVRLIQSIALDHGPAGIRANVVNPGWIRSEMADAEMDALGAQRGIDREAAYRMVTEHVPSRRAGTSAEAAAAIAWLLSPEAAYVNGSVLTVDGGTSAVGVGTLAFEPEPELSS